MDRILIKLGPINIYYYSFLIVSAIIIGLLLAGREAEENKLGKEYITDLVCYLAPIGVLGARVYYVIFNFDLFKDDILSIFKIWEGGLAIYGAVIFGVIFTVYYAKKKKKDVLLTMDTLVPYLILGQAIGRWGNFINQEAHGMLTDLDTLKSMHLPNFIIEGMYINGAYYIPTFLYESIWCFIGFIILIIVKSKTKYKKKGLLLSIYCIYYGIGRLIIEGMRTDSLYLGVFRVSQIVSIIIIIIGIILIFKMARRREDERK